jgi:hypothetical protein
VIRSLRCLAAAAAARAALLAAPFLAASFLATGCSSQTKEAPRRQPYKVLLLPVEGAARALVAAPQEASSGGGKTGALVPLSLTPLQLEQAVADGVHASQAFSEIVDAPPSVRGAAAASAADDMAGASEFARRVGADLILRVTVKSASIRDLGNNSSTAWSTVLWFMLPAPWWPVDDRTYDTNLAVEAALYEPRDTVKPTASVVATSGKQDLDLRERGYSWWVPVIPPAYLEGDPKTVSEEVTHRAMAQVMEKLAEELRTREIPSRFELAVQPEGGGVTVTAASRRQLRSVEVYVDGVLAKTWAENELVPDKDSTAERRVYTRTVPIGPAAPKGPRGAAPAAPSPAGPSEVRVVAEDEAGGREVRTITLGGRP